MINLTDSHCHIHESEFADKFDASPDEMLATAKAADVTKVVCVGTSVVGSQEAVAFVKDRPDCFASIAIHPHAAAEMEVGTVTDSFKQIRLLAASKPIRLVAIGECGLDYYYHADKKVRERQKQLFKLHLDLAAEYNLPLIFHIRDAFDDFFEIIDQYSKITGVVHSFTAHQSQLDGVLKRGLYIGLNGIMTFTKDQAQLAAAKAVPLNRLVLETDAPFLTPVPFRGTICEPKHVGLTAAFLSRLRAEPLEILAEETTKNAIKVLGLS